MEDIKLTRREAREQAFFLLFEKTFNDNSLDEIIDAALLARKIEIDDFSKKIFFGVQEHAEEIDSLIEKHCIRWKKNRLAKVTISILRLAVFELLFMEDIPENVSINEAIELAKLYGGKEDASFINGVLGNISKDIKGQL